MKSNSSSQRVFLIGYLSEKVNWNLPNAGILNHLKLPTTMDIEIFFLFFPVIVQNTTCMAIWSYLPIISALNDWINTTTPPYKHKQKLVYFSSHRRLYLLNNILSLTAKKSKFYPKMNNFMCQKWRARFFSLCRKQLLGTIKFSFIVDKTKLGWTWLPIVVGMSQKTSKAMLVSGTKQVDEKNLFIQLFNRVR